MWSYNKRENVDEEIDSYYCDLCGCIDRGKGGVEIKDDIGQLFSVCTRCVDSIIKARENAIK